MTLHARSVVAGSGAEMLQLDVVDTGCGIRHDRLAAIFEPFVQADSSTTREFGGTGLGLAICKQLSEMMGGGIEAGSELGRGSRFTVRIPLRPVPQDAAATGDAAPPVKGLQKLLAVACGPFDLVTDALTAHLARLGVAHRIVGDGDELDEVLKVAADGRVVVFHQIGGPAEAAEREAAETLMRASERGIDVVLVADLSHREMGERLRAAHDARMLWRPLRWGSVARILRRLVVDEEPTRPRPKHLTNVEGVRVLLAEDHPINQKLATRMLEKAGCRVTIAANGQEAIEQFERNEFDLVLMDMQMPVLDGLETTRRLRGLGGRGCEIPIVALTANAMKGDREACLKSGMDGYLTKPFRYDELLSTIEEWRSGRKVTHRAAPVLA